MERGQQVAALIAVLDRQAETARQLVDILGEERRTLTGSEPHALEAVTRRKDEARARLEELEKERRRLSLALGLGTDRRDFDAACGAQSPAALAARPRWQALTELLARCRDLNEANAFMVMSLRRRAQQALNVLRGESPTGNTYGPGGSASPTGRARPLGRV